jgi:2-polyprenyl-3-methyl-5-hydroxy-6-metoxy-1,4-benzoquinol methylase
MICYLCGHSDFTRRPGSVRDDSSLQILECDECGLVSLSSLEHIQASHYAESGMHGDALPSVETWLRDAKQDDQRRFEMLKSALVNSKVLDFGCGAAGFVLRAQGVAAEVVGIEPERRIQEHWAHTLRICGGLDAVGSGFDLITAFHVIEHLPDPRATLRALAQLLGERGRLVIEVPSSEDALLTLYNNDAFQRFTYWSKHLFLFNAETLRRLALQVGLRVVSIQQFQRYPLCNHLHWLSCNRPGGHRQWSFLDTPALNEAYASSLAAIGKCDTVIGHFENPNISQE